MSKSLPLILAAALSTAPLAADSPLVVVDANDQVLGQVVGSGSVNPFTASFLHRFGDNWLVVDAQKDKLYISTGPSLNFESADCSGQAYLDSTYTEYVSQLYMLLKGVFTLDGGTLFEVSWAESPEPVDIQSYRGADQSPSDTCHAVVTSSSMFAATLTQVGTLTSTPPYRVELNPIVFQDDFALNSFERWSGVSP